LNSKNVCPTNACGKVTTEITAHVGVSRKARACTGKFQQRDVGEKYTQCLHMHNSAKFPHGARKNACVGLKKCLHVP